MEVPQKTKRKLSKPTIGYIPQEECYMIIAAFFTVAKTQRKPKCLAMMGGLFKFGIYTLWNTSQLLKSKKFCHL